MCGVHLVGALLSFLFWLSDRESSDLWNSLKLLGIACLWFSILVVAGYIRSVIMDWLHRSQHDAGFDE